MARSPLLEEGAATPVVRRLMLALLVFGMIATAVDLYLLDHFEDTKQTVPFVAVGLGLVIVAWHVIDGGATSVRVLQAVMLAFLVSGIVGVVLHFRGNMEFQVDIDPTIGRWELFNKVMRAKAPPALAPGAMAQLGLLGLIYSYRHPALAAGGRSSSSNSGA
jgi:hypothetical protein